MTSGVLCKYTAMVAVDQDGKGVPKPKQEDIVVAQNLYSLPQTRCGFSAVCSSMPIPMAMHKKCAPGMVMFGGNSTSSSFGMRSMDTGTQERGCLREDDVDSIRPLSCKSEKRKMKKKVSSKSQAEECMVQPETVKANNRDDTFMAFVSLQAFDGSWKIEDVAKLIGIEICMLIALNSEKVSEMNREIYFD